MVFQACEQSFPKLPLAKYFSGPLMAMEKISTQSLLVKEIGSAALFPWWIWGMDLVDPLVDPRNGSCSLGGSEVVSEEWLFVGCSLSTSPLKSFFYYAIRLHFVCWEQDGWTLESLSFLHPLYLLQASQQQQSRESHLNTLGLNISKGWNHLGDLPHQI